MAATLFILLLLLFLVCIISSIIRRVEKFVTMDQAITSADDYNKTKTELKTLTQQRDAIVNDYNEIIQKMDKIKEVNSAYEKEPNESQLVFTENEKMDVDSWKNKLKSCENDNKDLILGVQKVQSETEDLRKQLELVKVLYDQMLEQIKTLQSQKQQKQIETQNAKIEIPGLARKIALLDNKLLSCDQQ